MKFLPLIWSGIWRKPGRTILVFLQVAVAFALFGVLQGLKTGVDEAIAQARADLLYVHSRGTWHAQLPLAHLEKIRSIPGVKLARAQAFFFATYQKPTQGLVVWAVSDLDEIWLRAFGDLMQIPLSQLAAFQKMRTGALASDDLVAKYGWKIGDRIPLNSTTAQITGSTDWAFDLLGIFADNEISSGGSHELILVHYPYFDEARLTGKGTAQSFLIVTSSPKEATTVADAIDRYFANSSYETQTDSYRELAQAQTQQIGDLNFAIRSIVSAVLVALLFSTATMMTESFRERTPELAVLKALGFTGGAVFLLVLAEAVAVCVSAALFGLALATLSFPWAGKFVPGISMPTVVIKIGISLSLILALVSVLLPGIRVARVRVATALAGR